MFLIMIFGLSLLLSQALRGLDKKKHSDGVDKGDPTPLRVLMGVEFLEENMDWADEKEK